MYKALSPGAMGLHPANLAEAIDTARKAGFDGVEFSAEEAANLIDQRGANHVKKLFADAGIRPAGFGLSVEWRKDEATW